MSEQIFLYNFILYSPLYFFCLGILIIYSYFIFLNFFSNNRISLFKDSVILTSFLIFITLVLYLINLYFGLYQNYNSINIISMKYGTNLLGIFFLILSFILFFI